MENKGLNCDFNILYEVYDLPLLQNKVYLTPELASNCPRGDVVLAQNLQSGLISNIKFKENQLIYDKDYDNNQSLSIEFKKHLLFAQSIILRYFNKRSNIIEIGCGNGIFIDMLSKEGFHVLGFDPAYQGKNNNIQKKYYDFESNDKFDNVIMRHVLEHVAKPFEFLNNLAKNVSTGGLIYIEVPCFEYIYNNNNWFDVFYEHVNYFQMSDFYGIFENVLEAGHCFGGQYIYVVADISTMRMQRYKDVRKISIKKDFGFHLDGQMKIDDIVWGGSSKGVIYSLLRARAGLPVRAVIDINEKKQGYYLPGTGLMVHSPSSILPNLKSDTRILIMNPNYANEIKKQTLNKFNYINIEQNNAI